MVKSVLGCALWLLLLLPLFYLIGKGQRVIRGEVIRHRMPEYLLTFHSEASTEGGPSTFTVVLYLP